MRILNLQRMSTEDGPGLRTTVFVKGCPLRCRWCHNPESIACAPSVEWFSVRCMGCGSCLDICPGKALRRGEHGLFRDEDKCRLCFSCVDACPTGALEIKGTEMSVEELFKELIKDKAFFGKDGGVTLSGGEITMQHQEAAALLKLLGEAGIHRAVDTCGLCTREQLDALLSHTDLFLYDLKVYDPQRHRQWTGADNRLILENFEYLCEKRQQGALFSLWVRTPIIPGATDDPENIRGLAQVVRDRVDRWELCAFNNLCGDKYERLGHTWQFQGLPLMKKECMAALVQTAESAGAQRVLYTGRTRREESS